MDKDTLTARIENYKIGIGNLEDQRDAAVENIIATRGAIMELEKLLKFMEEEDADADAPACET